MRRVIADFWAAVGVAATRPETAGPYMSGSRLSWAAAQVLGAQGAGVSMSEDGVLRLPWGASSDTAAVTEVLQFTAGQGPCLTAFTERQPVRASAEVLQQVWPAFHTQLVKRTPYRSVYGAPLGTVGVMNLYFDDPAGCTGVHTEAASAVAAEVLTAMINDQVVSMLGNYSTLKVPSMARRTQVAVAMGMLTAAMDVSYPDALALLRAHAFAADQGVDEVAAEVVRGHLDPASLR